MISERKKYITKLFLNKCSATDTMRQHLKFHLKLMEGTYEISKDNQSALKNKYNIDDYIERLMPIIDKQFTIEELQKLIKFFSSDIGRKMLDPNFLKEIGKAGDKMISQMEHEISLRNTGNNS